MNKKNPKENLSKIKKIVKRRKKVKPQQLIGMEMEKIYAIINITQTKRTEEKIIVEPISCPVVENILRDCQISFIKCSKIDGVHYTLTPPPEIKTPDEAFIFTEELLDEIADDEERSCFDEF
jgi:hypothetical protein